MFNLPKSSYSPYKSSKVNYEYLDRLSPGFSYASPQNKGNSSLPVRFQKPMTLPKRLGHCVVQTYPCQCCLSRDSDACVDMGCWTEM